MSDPTSLSSAAHVYKRLVPQPVRTVAASTVPGRVRRKVKRGLARALGRREARLHRRALRRVRKAEFGRSERRTRAHDGRIGHVHTGLTVDLARRLDHNLVTHALDAADIPWFAVPALDDRRICLAVEQRDKGAVRRALRALLEEHTGYVVSVSPSNSETQDIPGSHVKAWKHFGKAKVIRLTWLRTDPTENLWVGEDQGIEIEFWTVNTDLPQERVIGPRPNRVQRAAPSDALGIEIGLDRLSGYLDIDGAMEPTITLENFDVPRLEEITFPVDAVLLHQHATPWGEELLRAALRSLHQYAPWTDVVHVVAQAPVPPWLQADERLSIVPARPGAEWRLHQLPDIAEQFLLLRPGALLGRPVRAFDYFTPHGVTRPRRGPWTAQESFAPWTRAAYAATGRVASHGWAEGPQPYSCEVFSRLAESGTAPLPPADAQTLPAVPGTHPMDGLLHHIAAVAGLADPSGEATVVLHAAHPGIDNHLERLLVRRDSQQIQFVGLGAPAALGRGGTEAVLHFLRRYHPVPSIFEHGAPEEPDNQS
ncbi:sugar phosphotransferase [Streptomyces ipomoeae]|uniref:Exopolysaccharide phosphotransferase family protein n=2 Tax=Streptomyces ipomoeae TaxID=103232 RepID=L1KSU1_9ACTN|nr:exopolysaccharide phosphotransferase family protein [Streptomyces ipomoeae]EKX63702.1 exopolysaccharide phosphotransferase family protein [Streptomyces ipomoeae 91-03]MDX2692344.1 sugar phosphotransferase [Streptomyces ipomoeae]MDX2820261.1 sugar phosphotransferase [Streptomyces ipomoeae]MDX2840393.1 sugar phosphotransferase [Streptomyces ipomoeae]MDX2875506.1 sugar phosphotransferase [Streptomyces ipomoeae]